VPLSWHRRGDREDADAEVHRLLALLRRSRRGGVSGGSPISIERVSARLAALGETAVAPLLDELDSLGTPGAVALARVGRPALPAVVRALPESAPGRRVLLLRTLGMCGLPEAVAPLRSCLGDRDETVRRAAGLALERLAKGFVRELADGARREQAMDALVAIGAPAAWAVAEALRDLRRGLFAAQVMGRLGAAGVRPSLTVLINEGHSVVPGGRPTLSYASRALTAIGVPAVDPLADVLFDRRETPAARATAAAALAEMGAIAAHRLDEALRVADAPTRRYAAAALGIEGAGVHRPRFAGD
jgi:HEAT repeat protein